MKLSIKNKGSNYLAKIFKIENLTKHPNANKLQITNLNFNSIIIGENYNIGELVVLFEIESCINLEFLSWSNSFRDKNRNVNKEIAGFFEDRGRVKAIKLRGIKSEGYIVPLKLLFDWWKEKTNSKVEFNPENFSFQEFDSIDNILICEKYIPVVRGPAGAGDGSTKGVKARHSTPGVVMVPDQLRLHCDTEPLKKYLSDLREDDIISITEKVHGSNFSLGNLLYRRKLKWYEKLLKKIGIKIQDQEYGTVCNSRRAELRVHSSIKPEALKYNSGYKGNIWQVIHERIGHAILPGITVYGEIVGYDPTGKFIQKDYDYGNMPGHCSYYIFRITYTSPVGNVFEFTFPQVEAYCKKYNLTCIPLRFYGLVNEIIERRNFSLDNWRQEFLEWMVKAYLEQDCNLCKNKVPNEGVVLTIERGNKFRPYKLKSFNFLQKESKDLDTATEVNE